MKKEISRREALMYGRDFIVASALISGGFACSSTQNDEALEKAQADWNKELAEIDKKGSARIVKIKGLAVIGRRVARLDAEVKSGEKLHVGKKSMAILAMADNSLIKVKSDSSLLMDLDSRGGGFFRVQNGALLSVVNPIGRRPYIIKGASAMVGVKGTVLYTHILDARDKWDRRIPDSATDYICLCNGESDFMEPQGARTLMTDRATYHNARLIGLKNNDIQFQKADFLLNHSDKEIYNLIEEMKGEKPNRNWLKLVRIGY